MDHITNFPDVEYVKKMLVHAGFNILYATIYNMQDDFPGSNDKSIGMAFVCERR